MPEQMRLFDLPDAEAIRLRVAAELARQRDAARRREARMIAASAPPVCVLQLTIWGEAVQVCTRAPRPRKPAPRPARPAVLPAVAAVASVFALAQAGLEIGRRWFRPVRDAAPGPARVIREGGTVRLVRLQAQETPEWQERERARRAKQRPPRPTKKARTRGEKLLALIGEGGGKDGA